ncbi:hypothetical protein EXIGUO8H_20339 [Exiguobacterium sp. 8H]|uniref:polysaccharide deacetylase family protein n=1 Tax=unclassified Exiguobacterium TaxID=2644629 RepID=UPI0012F33EF4|nr:MULTISPECIES: polysaccharide deacetylase family protein [unclassified Exiguobacterium]VXB51914.1 conserved hypothetical protein [Exiguobacterium sp. 8A]VXB52637.1 hypothetical protein EXIGUO8H_20339 [Exiguobacterium sp. 8H]
MRTVSLADDFMADTQWSLQSGAGTTKTVDTVNTLDIQSLKLAVDGSVTTIGFMRRTNFSLDVSDKTAVDVTFFVADVTKVNRVVVFLSNQTNFASYKSKIILASDMKDGWNTVSFSIENMSESGTFDQGAPVVAIQLRLEAVSGEIASVSFDRLDFVTADRGFVLFTMDDGWDTQFTEGYRILNAQGIPGNIGLIPNAVGMAGKMSAEQFQMVYDAGWDLLNHTATHPNLSTLTKEAQRIELNTCRDYLVAQGWTRGAHSVVYPFGAYNTDTLDVLSEEGYVWGRTLVNGLESQSPINNYFVRTVNLVPSVTDEKAKEWIDEATLTGTTIVFLNHRFGTDADLGDTMFWTIDRFEELVAYTATRQQQGAIDALSVSEWLSIN